MSKKIAIVADWLTTAGGAEKVIYDIWQLFPEATIFTTIYNSKKLPEFQKADVRTSFLQNFPMAKKRHQLYLGLMPFAFESFDLSDYDLVISSSFACAKGIITKPETVHICYCHNPMRYIWDESHQYQKEYNLPKFLKFLAKPFLHNIRKWDQLTKNRVDHFITNSNFVAKRVQKYYKKPATTIHPGIAINPNQKILQKKKDFYLAAGRLTPFKRFDLIVEAFNITQKNLIIAGTGTDFERLKSLNTNPNTQFLGFVPDQQLSNLYAQAKAFIFPQIEDFGITPLEAQAHGCPVIAFSKGGVLETVINNKTGIFFNQQTATSLNEAIQQLDTLALDYNKIREHSLKFSTQNFKKQLKDYILSI